MSRFSRLEVLGAILDSGLLPLFHCPNIDRAVEIVVACSTGGARAIEFTNRGDRANVVFGELIARSDSLKAAVPIGVGSVVDTPTAALFIELGADFVVGPTFDRGIAELCNRRRIAYIPGCGTMNEIVAAETAGCEIVKLFPADAAGGPGFIKSILGPRPATRVLPTGGISPTADGIRMWIEAGAAALGIGSRLIPTPPPANFDAAELRSRVAQILAWIAEARGEVPAASR